MLNIKKEVKKKSKLNSILLIIFVELITWVCEFLILSFLIWTICIFIHVPFYWTISIFTFVVYKIVKGVLMYYNKEKIK